MKKKLTLLFLLTGILFCGTAHKVWCQTYSIKIHSHNDYEREVPFYEAYSQKVNSIEADVFLKNGELLVGHQEEDLVAGANLNKMYIQPIVNLFKDNQNKAWKGSVNILQLLIDLKTESRATLKKVVEIIAKYPDVFNPSVNPYAVRVVITGNVPSPGQFVNYPDFIFFDGRLEEKYSDQELKRVLLFSEPFFNYAYWNGRGLLTTDQKDSVVNAINCAHRSGKPIRFWGAPDNMEAWATLYDMGVDFINTDHVEDCSAFLKRYPIIKEIKFYSDFLD